MEVKTLMVTTIEKQQEDEIVHVQTVMHSSKAQALKTKSGAKNLKDALNIAVNKYMEE